MRGRGAKPKLERTTQAPSPFLSGPAADMRIARLRIAGEDYVVFSAPAEDGAALPLTQTERAVHAGLVAGRSNRELAQSRGVSERTIANQAASIFRKLGVRS